MKFLCDVHISFKLVRFRHSSGFEAIHVNDILNKSETKDAEICRYADDNNYVVITKDSDFKDTYLVKRSPQKLIKINLGNIPNNDLIQIFDNHLSYISKLDRKKSFLLEIDRDDLRLIISE